MLTTLIATSPWWTPFLVGAATTLVIELVF